MTVHPADIEHGIYLSGEKSINTMNQENVRYVVEKDLSRTLNKPYYNQEKLPQINAIFLAVVLTQRLAEIEDAKKRLAGSKRKERI